LITNFHVIEGETQISVEVYHQKKGELDRKSYKQVRIIAMNKFADLALLRVEDKEAPLFSWVLLADSDSLAVGERVFAIGSPLGLERTVTEGIVSTKTRQMQGELYLQTTAQINPGNSGGPLFNMRGEVIGVTNMKLAFGEGLGFAIPVESVKYFLNHRDAYAYDNDNPSNAFRYLDPPSRTRNRAPPPTRPPPPPRRSWPTSPRRWFARPAPRPRLLRLLHLPLRPSARRGPAPSPSRSPPAACLRSSRCRDRLRPQLSLRPA
jgi:serine protease Do